MYSLFNIIVKKLWKKQWKIINGDDIYAMYTQSSDEIITPSKIHKLTYTLRNKGHLMSIKKNTFLCTKPDKQPDEAYIVQNYYRELVKKHCEQHITGARYIGWVKALELYLQNYEIPENIDIININKNALEVVMFNRTINYKTYNNNNKTLFTTIKKHLDKLKIGKYTFNIAPIELAILESLHNPSAVQSTLINEYIKKIIRKSRKSLNLDFFILMLQHKKHHVGVNRLYTLSKSIDHRFAESLLEIIKKYSFIISE